MVGRILRCRIAYKSAPGFAPESIIAKLPSADDNTRQTARQLQLYQREFDFYRVLSAFVPVRTPALVYGDFDSSTHEFVLLLEDLGEMASVDQVEGATEDQVFSAIRTAAELHAQFWGRVDRPPVYGVYAPPSPERHAMVQAVYQASLPRVFDIFSDHFTGPASACRILWFPSRRTFCRDGRRTADAHSRRFPVGQYVLRRRRCAQCCAGRLAVEHGGQRSL